MAVSGLKMSAITQIFSMKRGVVILPLIVTVRGSIVRNFDDAIVGAASGHSDAEMVWRLFRKGAWRWRAFEVSGSNASVLFGCAKIRAGVQQSLGVRYGRGQRQHEDHTPYHAPRFIISRAMMMRWISLVPS